MSAKISNDHTLEVLRIDAPDWFARADFQRWLNRTDRLRPATWHAAGSPPSDFSDVFTVFDSEEGPDFAGGKGDFIPEDIWEFITKACEQRNTSYAVIWITNLEMED
jgi:hypothetical protein